MTKTSVDFSYAFATPHRVCVCLPDSSDKTLYDCTADKLTVLWSDRDTTTNPLGAYKRVRLDWKVEISSKADNNPMTGFSWKRIKGYIPSLHYKTRYNDLFVDYECVASKQANIIKITASNKSDKPVNITVNALVKDNTINTKWVDFDCKYSAVNPIFNDASDRIVIMDASKTDTVPMSRESVTYEFSLNPGQSEQKFLLKPYKKYNDDIEHLVSQNWNDLFKQGLNEWERLIKPASFLHIPDPVVEQAYKACVCDLFVLRELQADGKMAGLAGTEMYRSANTGEPCLQAATLCRYGYIEQAKENIDFVAQFQLENGSWEDDKQWGKYMWGMSGWKSIAIHEYYLRTKDRKYLESSFERMLKSARWSKTMRQKTKDKYAPDSPYYGLMPRGMGDGGLKVGDDLFGIFYPHNFMHCRGLEIAAWAAKELGRNDIYDELDKNHKDMKDCIIASLEKGHIKQDDFSWIGSSANNTSGSRWGVAEVIYPTRILALTHPLSTGTMKKLQYSLSEGGLPKNLGWMPDGLWVAIALDAMAYVNMLYDNSDISANYLIAALNHSTPLFSWCEERSEEKNSSRISGDLQHAWTPIAVARFIREMLVSDIVFDDDKLHLGAAVPEYFFDYEQGISVDNAPTVWGKISYSMKVENDVFMFGCNTGNFDKNTDIVVHLPEKFRNKGLSIKSFKGGKADIDGNKIYLTAKSDNISLKAGIT